MRTCSGKWYQVDLLQRICTCGRFQYNDIPCGHAVAVIQRYRPPPPTTQCNARDYIARNLTFAAMNAIYTQVMPPVDVGGLQVPLRPELWECRPPLFKKPKGCPLTARIAAKEQRARRAARAGALPDIPNHIQRCSRCREEGHNVLKCRALPEGM